MKDLAFWRFLQAQLKAGQPVGWLQVLEHEGSSPGRQGFRMAIASNGGTTGSVGGGIMEHKLVEVLRDHLKKREPFWEIKRQIHSKEVAKDQSGMICSGSQLLALMYLGSEALEKVEEVILYLEKGESVAINVNAQGWSLEPSDNLKTKITFTASKADWRYTEKLGPKAVAHVIGGGHVGLEMCKVLTGLDYFVCNYDDRPGLNTFEANPFAHKKIITDYADLSKYIPSGDDQFVIVMTFGYRGDDVAVRALLKKRFRYFGMMGSKTKVATLLEGLRKDGFEEADIAQIKTPAGVVLHCETPAEIAVSIAAEMIGARNSS